MENRIASEIIPIALNYTLLDNKINHKINLQIIEYDNNDNLTNNGRDFLFKGKC